MKLKSLPGVVAVSVAVIVLAAAPATAAPPAGGVRKPTLADTVRVNVYADNWFMLYVNGRLVAVDSIEFIPHNVISVDMLPTYPMTIAVMAKDNADAATGMEYANTGIGDGGFILKFSDGTVTSRAWKAKCFAHGPVARDTTHPRQTTAPIPDDWFAVGFDDRDWPQAQEYAEQAVGPKQPYYEADFSGATFIWTDDLELDNTVIFRHTVAGPPDGRPRLDFTDLNNQVPAGPPGRGRAPPPRSPPLPRGGSR